MKKILMIDDEEDLLFLVQQTLGESGKFEVTTSSRAGEVLDLCRKVQPDLILLDLVMPKVNGKEVIKKIRGDKETKKIPIIVTSGFGEMVYLKKKDEWKWLPNRPGMKDSGEDFIKERHHEKAAQLYGVDDFLTKPFSTDILISVIEEVLARKKKSEEPESPSSPGV